MSKRILIVDDEPDICRILAFNLELEGYEVDVADRPVQFGDKLPDLILLDVMMTPKSGFEWAGELKSDPRTAGIPIIFCTAKTMEQDVLKGFELGSDDYICKPFRLSEVKARVRAVLRRSGDDDVHSQERTLRFEGIVMYMDRKECTVDGVPVPFTKLEFEVLSLLISRPGQVLSREFIIDSVWPSGTVVLDRTVDVNITRIRKKIGPYGECLRTRFGYGYMLSR